MNPATQGTKAARIFFLFINYSVTLQLNPTKQSDWSVWGSADEHHKTPLLLAEGQNPQKEKHPTHIAQRPLI